MSLVLPMALPARRPRRSFGTLIGAGGGFLLVPLLILLYPNDTPDTVTSMGLGFVAIRILLQAL